MNLNVYYQKIRECEAGIAEDCAIVISNETPDGGKPGVKTEVPKRVAAKMVAEGTARLAEPAEAAAFREAQKKAKMAADDTAAAAKLQLTVVPATEYEAMKRGSRAKA